MPYVGREANSFTTVVDVTVSDDLTVTDDATIGGALSAKGGAVFNEDSVDVDFRVESNGEANMLFVDGGNDRVVMSKSSAGATTFPLVLTNPPNNSASTAVGLRFVPTNATIGDRTIDIVGSQTSAGGNAMELKFLVSNGGTAVERMRIHAAGTVSFNNGIELGSGLDATAANTLDDYEEGTFTPTQNYQNSTNNNAASVNAASGRYTKIGNVVHFTIRMNVEVPSSLASDNYTIQSFPFASENITNVDYVYSSFLNGKSLVTNPIHFMHQPNQAVAFMTDIQGTGNGGPLMGGAGSGTSELNLTGTYRTA